MLALQSFSKQPGVSSLVASGKDLGGEGVFSSNPRGKNSRKEDLEKVYEAAGLHLVGVNINSYDMKNLDARKKAQEEASKVLSNYIIGGAGAAFGVSKHENAVTPGISSVTVQSLIGFERLPAAALSSAVQLHSGRPLCPRG
ncbi:hypothetical protein [uncultured Microbulbifer sp.]|uniref:hypothetical protein n=1 Tax=uncultured Microbulbifer sp. TaxID=348147 RepID=UPI00260CC1C4|nr:hypothetical protein [uncultured Microbulbifer sp.]